MPIFIGHAAAEDRHGAAVREEDVVAGGDGVRLAALPGACFSVPKPSHEATQASFCVIHGGRDRRGVLRRLGELGEASTVSRHQPPQSSSACGRSQW
jgi:hypothetical protein